MVLDKVTEFLKLVLFCRLFPIEDGDVIVWFSVIWAPVLCKTQMLNSVQDSS